LGKTHKNIEQHKAAQTKFKLHTIYIKGQSTYK